MNRLTQKIAVNEKQIKDSRTWGDALHCPGARGLLFLAVFCLFGRPGFGQKDSAAALPDSLAATRSPVTDSLRHYYTRFGLSPDSAENPLLYYHVHDWVGTRYCRAGHTKKGIDCSGFVSKMYSDCYQLSIGGSSVDLYNIVDTVSKKQLQEGDILFFKIRKGQISHVGIYLGNNKFAHATVHGGVMINDLDEAYYRKYYFTGGRLKAGSRKKILVLPGQ